MWDLASVSTVHAPRFVGTGLLTADVDTKVSPVKSSDQAYSKLPVLLAETSGQDIASATDVMVRLEARRTVREEPPTR